jgi:hypothetical protein
MTRRFRSIRGAVHIPVRIIAKLVLAEQTVDRRSALGLGNVWRQPRLLAGLDARRASRQSRFRVVIEQDDATSVDRSAQLSGAGLKLVIADHRLDHGDVAGGDDGVKESGRIDLGAITPRPAGITRPIVPKTREEVRIAAGLIGIRFNTVRQWFHRGAIDTRFDALEARVSNIETELRQIRKRLDALEEAAKSSAGLPVYG